VSPGRDDRKAIRGDGGGVEGGSSRRPGTGWGRKCTDSYLGRGERGVGKKGEGDRGRSKKTKGVKEEKARVSHQTVQIGRDANSLWKEGDRLREMGMDGQTRRKSFEKLAGQERKNILGRDPASRGERGE